MAQSRQGKSQGRKSGLNLKKNSIRRTFTNRRVAREVGSSLSLEVLEQMLENCLATMSKVSQSQKSLRREENYHADYCC